MRILVADDDKDLASYLAEFVSGCGHEVVATVTTGGMDVLHLYDFYKPDAVLMDIMMPQFNGLTICHALVSKTPAPKVILISGKLSAAHPFVENSGASAFLQKPIRSETIRRVLDEICQPAKAAA